MKTHEDHVQMSDVAGLKMPDELPGAAQTRVLVGHERHVQVSAKEQIEPVEMLCFEFQSWSEGHVRLRDPIRAKSGMH